MKRFKSYSTCSPVIKRQIQTVTKQLSATLSDSLLGLYLNGSIVFNSFDESSSDIDMVGIINRILSTEEKIALGKLLLSVHNQPAPLEVLLLVKDHIMPWQYPPICHFYFSEYFVTQYKQFLLGDNLNHRLLTVNSNTLNVTSEIKITKDKGIHLYGAEINKFIPSIPDADFWDAISSNANDYDPASNNDSHRPFAVLTLCRILSYRKTKRHLSKQQAAAWAMEVLPAIFKPIIATALHDKYALGERAEYPISDAVLFKQYILEAL